MLDVPSKVRWSGKWQGTEILSSPSICLSYPLKERETATPLRHYQNYLPYVCEGSTCNWCVRKAVMSKIKATFQGVVVFFFFSTGGERWPGDGELLR